RATTDAALDGAGYVAGRERAGLRFRHGLADDVGELCHRAVAAKSAFGLLRPLALRAVAADALGLVDLRAGRALGGAHAGARDKQEQAEWRGGASEQGWGGKFRHGI